MAVLALTCRTAAPVLHQAGGRPLASIPPGQALGPLAARPAQPAAVARRQGYPGSPLFPACPAPGFLLDRYA